MKFVTHVLCITACLLVVGCGDDPETSPMMEEPEEPMSEPMPAECAGTEDFALGLEKTGEEGLFVATIMDASPSPPEKFENDWVVEISDDSGSPVTDGDITAQPFMPLHGHDGTFDPEVEAMDEPGVYAIDRINMWMGGPWEVRIFVETDGASDKIVYDVCIEE